MATAEAFTTAEEFEQLSDGGVRSELIRGRIVRVTIPTPRHGQICAKIVIYVGDIVEERGLGRVVCNDSGVITERDPDTVRGADVAYYSYARVPSGPLPKGYLKVAPDLVFEVRSPDDPWREIHEKVVEYLNAGVTIVCVVDSTPETIHVFSRDKPVRIVKSDETLTLPEVLDDFQLRGQRLFE